MTELDLKWYLSFIELGIVLMGGVQPGQQAADKSPDNEEAHIEMFRKNSAWSCKEL